MNEKRSERLLSDRLGMLELQDRPYMSWTAIKGEPPYIEEYLLDIKLRTYVLTSGRGMYNVGVTDRCLVKVTLWDSYPHVAPNIKMLNIPPVFHPDWYSKGTYCSAEPWSPDTPLKDWIKRMLRTLTYDPSVIAESGAPANYKALEWFMKNRDNAGLFPSDDTALTPNSAEETAAIEAKASRTDIIDSWRI